jgi:hypothetical protein
VVDLEWVNFNKPYLELEDELKILEEDYEGEV